MKASYATLGRLAAFAVVGCYPTHVRTDYDHGASFAQLRTYNWINSEQQSGGDPAVDNPLVGKRVRSAVDRTLTQMGYREVSADDADFRVKYRIVATETAGGGGYGGYGGYYRYGGFYGHRRFGGHHGFHGGHRFHGRSFLYSPYSYGGYDPYYSGGRDYLESTLFLDITDAATGELIWRGWAEKLLHDNPKPEEVQEHVNEAVEKMLARFPPTSPSSLVDR